MRKSFEAMSGPLAGQQFALDLGPGDEAEFVVDGVTHVYRASVRLYDDGSYDNARLHYVGIAA